MVKFIENQSKCWASWLFFLFMLNFWLKKRFNLHFKFFLFYFSVGFLDSSKKIGFHYFLIRRKFELSYFDLLCFDNSIIAILSPCFAEKKSSLSFVFHVCHYKFRHVSHLFGYLLLPSQLNDDVFFTNQSISCEFVVNFRKYCYFSQKLFSVVTKPRSPLIV